MSFMKYIRRIFGNTLYYPGCMTKYVLKDVKTNYITILNKLKVPHITIEKEFCCGSPIVNAGYFEDFDNLKQDNIDLFNSYGVSRILFNCPSCFNTFSKMYSNDLSNVEMEHFSTFLLPYLKSGKLQIDPANIKAMYHDPCHLGRAMGIYDEPRELLNLLGVEVVELLRTKQDSRCCGAGGGLKNFDSDVSENIALKTLKSLINKDIHYLISTCPMCYFQFKTIAEKNNLDIRVMELSQVIIELMHYGKLKEKSNPELSDTQNKKAKELNAYDC